MRGRQDVWNTTLLSQMTGSHTATQQCPLNQE
jgi:hypothetical protein